MGEREGRACLEDAAERDLQQDDGGDRHLHQAQQERCDPGEERRAPPTLEPFLLWDKGRAKDEDEGDDRGDDANDQRAERVGPQSGVLHEVAEPLDRVDPRRRTRAATAATSGRGRGVAWGLLCDGHDGDSHRDGRLGRHDGLRDRSLHAGLGSDSSRSSHDTHPRRNVGRAEF